MTAASNGAEYRCFITDANGDMGSTRVATIKLDILDWEMEYNTSGIRTKRISDEKTYSYIYAGDKLMRMTVGNDTLDFSYDANGMPLTVTHNGTVYYYITNLQGDVMSVERADGGSGAQYAYDAWGNIIAMSGTLAELNPLRYRGYVYDQETGFYYLNSRYYDPAVGRFISADSYTSTGQGIIGNNTFAYCNNNPVAYADFTGGFAWFVAANAFIGAAIGAVTQVTANVLSGNNQLLGEKSMFKGVVGASLGGAVFNVVSLTTGNLVAASAAGAATEAIVNEAGAYVSGKKRITASNLASSTANVVTTTVTNSMTAVVTGKIASNLVKTNSGWFQPRKFISSFTGKYARRIWKQTAVQGAMTAAYNITKTFTNYLFAK